MSVTGHTGLMSTGSHSGYIAGRYRDGALSDTWTDVVRCARGTFVGYVPVCTCGWTGAIHPATVAGFQASQHALVTEHLSPALERDPWIHAERAVVQAQCIEPCDAPAHGGAIGEEDNAARRRLGATRPAG